MPGIISDAPISIQQPHSSPSSPLQGAVNINHQLGEYPLRCMQETQTEELVPSSSQTNDNNIHTHIFSENK